ncbi:MAG: radical SAM protein [archaeon]
MITFINPPSCNDIDFSAKQSVIPPEGLCLLAACTRKAGYKTSLIDAPALGLSMKQVVDEIGRQRSDFVGLTASTITIHDCSELAKLIRKDYPNVKIFIGGPHITVAGEETMKYFQGDFDVGVYGEAEITIVELLDSFTKKKPLKEIDGIMFFDKNKLVITKKRMPIKDLDDLPMPAWDLLPDIKQFYKQSVARADRFPSFSLMTSRGCPGQCIFCASENKLRSYSAERLIEIVKHLIHTYEIKSLEINDDNFVVFRDRLIKFCNTLIDEKIDLTWSCFSRVNHVDEKILNLMAQAGCKRIAYGIESGSQKILDFEKKGITLEQIKKAVKFTHKAGIHVTGYFIIGHPLETKESMQKTIDFAKSLPLDDFLPSYMVPYPGTELYEMGKKYGKFEKDWKRMYQWNINFIPNGLTQEDLEYYFKKGFREFYFRPKIFYNYTKKALNPRHTWRFMKDGLGAVLFIAKGK